MATVKKSKKKIIVIVSIILVIAIISGVIFGVVKSNSGEEVQLYTVSTGDIYESVSLTGEVSSGTSKEYKVGTVAKVKEVFVKVGDNVKQNDVLATFDVSQVNEQVNELRGSYNSALKTYNAAVKQQKSAKSKASAISKEIKEVEKKIQKLQNSPAKPTKPITNKPLTTATTKKETQTTQTTVTKPTESSSETTNPEFGGLTDALEELNKTLAGIVEDMDKLTELTAKIAEDLARLGELDEEKIAEMIVQDMVESGILEETAKEIVDSIDFDALGKAIANSDNANLTSASIQLISLQAQHAIYSAQADTTALTVQKTAVDTTKKALDTLEAQQKEMADGWKAAFDGTITAVDIYPGEQTTMLTAGITLENLNSMSVKINLGEYDLPKVRLGMPAIVTTAYGTYDAEVASIAPTATGGSGTSILDSVGSMAGISGLSSLTDTGAGVECVISVPKADSHIVAGFDANVQINTGEYLGVVTIPTGSIKLEKTGSYVYVYNEEHKTVTKTKIETGSHDDSVYEVKSGINVGDKIVLAPSTTYEEDTFKVKVVDK